MRHKLLTKTKILIGLALILVVSIGVTTLFAVTRTHTQPAAVVITPNFQTFIPKDKTITELGGWQKLTPPNGEAFYVFSDTIDGVPITVSQQLLPDSFSSNPNESLKALAEAYSATDSIDASGTKVYIGKSSQGPQSLLLIKGSVLILIKSEQVISNNAWTTYINSLS